jgi:hypothetical protein
MRTILSMLALALCFTACASNQITVSLTVTNSTTNGVTFSVNGDTRTFTNQLFNSANQVLTNSDATGCGSKTNLFNQIGLNRFSQIIPNDTGSNTFQLIAPCGVALVVTPSAGYMTVSYSTQVCAVATPVAVPFANYYASTQTRSNTASQLALDIDNYDTNNTLLDLSKTQTVTGAKTFSSASGVWKGSILNSPSIIGDIGYLRNGSLSNVFIGWGGGTFIDNTGHPNFASGVNITTAGAANWGLLDVLFDGTLYFGVTPSGGSPILSEHFTTNEIDLYLPTIVYAPITLSSNVTVGLNATVAGNVSVGTNLTVAKNATVTGNAVIAGNFSPQGLTTNLTLTGTNTYAPGSDIAFTPYSLSSLANGNNADIPVGTNVIVEVFGPSGAFTINGISAAGALRGGKHIWIVNLTGFDMTFAHQSGVEPTAANRIISLTGADQVTTGNGAVELYYSTSSSRWVVMEFSP